MGIRELIDKTQEYLPSETVASIEDAYEFALEAHQGQTRRSGEPYMEHPLATAMNVADLQLDAEAVVAALLHDVPEDCQVPLSQIEARFGAEVSKLVDGTTKLSKISWPALEEGGTRQKTEAREYQAENLRKMLVAMAEDLRVVFIKLADRLHNMHTLEAMPPPKRRSIAQETMEIYAPLAHRLGIWELKWQLEDSAFRYLEPQRYRQLARLLAARRVQRESFIDLVTGLLRVELKKARLKAEVVGRPKHIYSIYQKMQRYTSQDKRFDDIHDLLALRVLVDGVTDCYSVLGVIHSLWHPLSSEFDDFIANPKPNGYQSLHTTVMYQGTTPLEIQIRTHEMHRFAEYGIAAHWRYKEGPKKKKDRRFEEKVGWLRQLIEWHRELSGAEEFLESVKTDIFIDQVFVFTPKGEIKDLPLGATPLDFAYRIHTDLGHRCIGAKVNGRLVALDYQLRNGDTVEILSSKGDKGPSRDWLNPHLGYVNSSHAREKIRQWFKRQERTENIERGKQLLEKEMRRLGISLRDQEKLAPLFRYESLEDFFAAVGYGGISPHQIALKLAVQEEEPRVVAESGPQPVTMPAGIKVLGVGDLLTHRAQCCHPMPGDEIVGYITRGRGVIIHRKDCHNVSHEDERERLIRVDWGHMDQFYPVSIQIEAWDRVGLLRDISAGVAAEKVNIGNVSSREHEDGTTSIRLILETRSIAELSRLLSRLEAVRGVISAARVLEGVK